MKEISVDNISFRYSNDDLVGIGKRNKYEIGFISNDDNIQDLQEKESDLLFDTQDGVYFIANALCKSVTHFGNNAYRLRVITENLIIGKESKDEVLKEII